MKHAEVLEVLVPTPQYAALLFDWDGTVPERQGVNFEALCEAMAGHDLRLDREWFDSHPGTSTADAIRLVAAEQGRSADPDLIADQRNALFLNRVADVDLVDRTRDLIDVRPLRRADLGYWILSVMRALAVPRRCSRIANSRQPVEHISATIGRLSPDAAHARHSVSELDGHWMSVHTQAPKQVV